MGASNAWHLRYKVLAWTAPAVGLWIAGLACQPAPVDDDRKLQALPAIVVNHDDFEVTQSCRLFFEGPIVDANGNGVVHVNKPDIVVSLWGQTLQGAPDGTPCDLLSGTGIRVTAPRTTIVGGTVKGFKIAVHATDAHNSKFSRMDLSDNFAQRLKSTPLAEDGADWLWPHANDNNEWSRNYGAALLIEKSARVSIESIKAWHGQNGIMLDRVTNSHVWGCDCSFLSGWGLSMWRSSSNDVTYNHFDFCVRGYSHGVYNRGQDSAGILCFEQCQNNVFSLNSVTHCGDGFFGFAGKEALGEAPAPQSFADDAQRRAWYRSRGCNGNVLYGNDFSYAVAHGIELTFSFNNLIAKNVCVDDAICGVWAGYSQHTLIKDNVFQNCGSGAYGGERGGINIEHGAYNNICHNQFVDNACGVRLWWDDDAALMKTPWAQANGTDSVGNAIHGNTFTRDRVGIELRDCKNTCVEPNTFAECDKDVDSNASTTQTLVADSARARADEQAAVARLQQITQGKELAGFEWLTKRKDLGGREAILMGPDGPYDWTRPRKDFDDQVAAMMRPYAAGIEPHGPWVVRAFPTTADPRKDGAAFRNAAAAAPVGESTALMLAFGGKGPSDLVLSGQPMLGARIAAANVPSDNFGLTATAAFTAQPGCWRVRVVSDDGVRVLMDGKPFIENWTWHVPTENSATFAVDAATEFELQVEYFELTGHAVLQLFIEPCPAK